MYTSEFPSQLELSCDFREVSDTCICVNTDTEGGKALCTFNAVAQ